MIWINIIAVIAAPIAAVWIGQKLQDRAEKRKDKMAVFKAIMTDRYGWSRETVLAFNSIPIVFAKDNAVRTAWKEYFKYLCIQEPDTMELKQTLFELLAAPGITGAEDDAAAVASRLLSAYMPVRRDTLGSVIGEQQGEGDGVTLDAHLDQIGLFVTTVTDDGFVKVSKCGGADVRTMACHEVRILGKKPLYGVVVSTPPHLKKGEDDTAKWEDVSIDVGLSAERARALISPGDRVQLIGKPREMLNGRVSSAALDDRAGVAAILRALEILREKNVQPKLTVVFSVQEESTGGGAAAAAFQSDDAAAIAIDVSFASAPGLSDTETKPMGKGTMIGLAPSLSRSLGNRLIQLAKDNGIPYQLETMGGRTGTNAEKYSFSKCGKKTGLLSIPIRNMHTNVEVCDLLDIEATAQLLALYVEGEGQV